MHTLITRKIEPAIEKYFRVLFFLTPIFIFNFSLTLNIVKLIIIIAIIGMILYEVKTYSDNKEFIKFIENNKQDFFHSINIKYLKIYASVALFTFLSSYIINLIFHVNQMSLFYLFSLLLLITFAVNEKEILNTEIKNLLLKYLILLAIMLTIVYISGIYAPILLVQLFYLFCLANRFFLNKQKNFHKKNEFINLTALLIFELLIIIYYYSIFLKIIPVLTPSNFNYAIISEFSITIPPLISFILISFIYFILSIILLSFKNMLIDSSDNFPDHTNKIKIFSIIFISLTTFALFCNFFLPTKEIREILLILFIIVAITILNCIIILIDNIVLKKIANKNTLKRINDSYDNWIK